MPGVGKCPSCGKENDGIGFFIGGPCRKCVDREHARATGRKKKKGSR